MAESPAVGSNYQSALESGDWDRIEELWLESLEQDPVPWPELLEVRRLLWQAGKKNLALTLLELLAESLEAAEDHSGALAALRDLIRLRKSSPPEDIERLESALTGARRGSPSLNAILERYRLTEIRKPVDVLDTMSLLLDHDVGTVVEVVGQGVGRVVDLNLELENVKVDIGGRRPVSVPFGAVTRFLRVLAEGDFLRLKVEEPEQLIASVNKEPGEALVHILEGLPDEVDVAAIKASLEDILPPTRWTSWWGKARKHPRIVSSGSGSRLRYSLSKSAEAATEALLDDLQTAEPRDRLALARRLAARGDDASAATAQILGESIAEIQEADPGLAWETAAVMAGLSGGREQAEATRAEVLASSDPLQLLAGVVDRGARAEALEAVKQHHEERWIEIWREWMLYETTPSGLDTIATELDRAGATDALDEALEAIFRNHNNHPEQFIWAAECMTSESAPASLKRRMTPSLLEKLPDTLARKEYAALRSRAKALLDGGKVAIRLLLESATALQASRFAKRISRIDAVEPQRQRLVEQAAAQRQGAPEEPEAPVLVATKQAIEAKRAELKELIEVTIPKTLKGINAAAAEGDLRENFEYHMLRDRQELQSAQAAKIQHDLGIVRTLVPGAADTSRVNIGTVVHLVGPDDQPLQPITILGAWDAAVERRIFANGTDLAKGLLGRSPGDEVEVEGQPATITRIEVWQGE